MVAGGPLNPPDVPTYRRHGSWPEPAEVHADHGMPKGATVSAHLRVVCPHCDTTNRVLRERLDAGANCGSCKRVLLPGRPLELTAANFDRHVAGNDLPLIVDFWALWCGPCRMMAPAYEQAAAQLAKEVRSAKLDTESVSGVATASRGPRWAATSCSSKPRACRERGS